MKLNNHGWGFKEMIILTSILLIFLFIASYYIVLLYKSFDTAPTTRYDELETKIIVAAKKYIKNEGSADLLTASELNDLGYLSSFYDNSGDICSGYVLIDEEYRAYINCEHYRTRGYSTKYDQ